MSWVRSGTELSQFLRIFLPNLDYFIVYLVTLSEFFHVTNDDRQNSNNSILLLDQNRLS